MGMIEVNKFISSKLETEAMILCKFGLIWTFQERINKWFTTIALTELLQN